MSLGDQVSDLVNLSKSPFREVLENLDSSKAWYLLIGENNPQNCVKLKDEVPRSRHDIVMFEPLGYLSNSTALEKGFEVLQWLMEKRKARSRVRSKLPPAIVFDIDATVIYNHTKSVNKPERSHKVTVSYKIYRWAIDNGPTEITGFSPKKTWRSLGFSSPSIRAWHCGLWTSMIMPQAKPRSPSTNGRSGVASPEPTSYLCLLGTVSRI